MPKSKKKSIVATAAVIPPSMLYLIADCSTSNPPFEIKYALTMTWAMNWEPTKYSEDAIALPLDDNLMKNCIIKLLSLYLVPESPFYLIKSRRPDLEYIYSLGEIYRPAVCDQ